MIITRIIRRFPVKTCLKHSNFAALNYADRLEKFRKMAPKSRENPIIKKLETPEFKSLFTEELTALASMFKEYGYEIRIAGGAVRDLLLGKSPKDLDFATTATPDQMKEMFTTENIRMINAKGEKHGTITPRINDKVNFEVTTLRIDLLTDGRHAEVQYTTDWLLDANRRDLTINSMFLGLDGSVYDYFYGYDDLQNRRVAFVGDAVTRIREDYLRILRYFRFYGRIATCPDKHDPETIKAITENASGLEKISGERIWMELKKILEGNFAGELLCTILNCKIGKFIGLPEVYNLEKVMQVWNQSKHLNLNAITILSTLISTPEQAMNLNNRIKLSAYERELLLFLIKHKLPIPHEKPLHPYKQLVLKGQTKDTRLYVIELLKYFNYQELREFEEWEPPKFPVSGNVLKEKGVKSGRFMGLVMNELKNYWADNDFNLSVEEILKRLPHVLAMLEEKRKK